MKFAEEIENIIMDLKSRREYEEKKRDAFAIDRMVRGKRICMYLLLESV